MRAVDLLGDLPDAPGMAPMRSIPSISADKAKEVAEEYESKLREEYSLKHDVPVSWFRRHWLPLTLAVAFAFAGAVGAGAWILYRQHYNQKHRIDFLDRAEGGLLLDTEASLTGASHQLAEVLGSSPNDPMARALSAQTAATLYREYGGPAEMRDQASDILKDAKLFQQAPDPAWTARYLLADDPKPLAAEILALPADKTGPWVDYLAGQLLLGKGQAPEALGRFNQALKKAAAHVPTLIAVGDYYLKAGDSAQAAQFFQLAHTASGQSVGAAVGLAEAHLAQKQAGPAGLAVAQEDEKALAAVAAATVPPAWRLRLDLATARVLAVDGQHDKAVAKLLQGVAAHGEDQGAYTSALADVGVLGGHYLEAEAAAQRALAKSPKDAEALERYAHILLGLGRYRMLLSRVQALASDPRTLHVLRARADYALGDCGSARREIEATRRGEKIPAGGAVVLALCDAIDGQLAPGRAALTQLASLPRPGATTFVALGDLDQKAGDLKGAMAAYKQGAAADSGDYEPHCALGRMLLADGRQSEGLAELDAALKLNNDHAEARVAYGLALLAAGKPEAAMPQLNAALAAAPDDEQVSLALARVLLTEKLFPDALRYATRATTLAPDDPEAHRWRGKVATALKQKKMAQNEGKLVAKLEKKKKDDAKAKAKALAKRKRS
jgi:tetratricopeptide (TPR) repeat protein